MRIPCRFLTTVCVASCLTGSITQAQPTPDPVVPVSSESSSDPQTQGAATGSIQVGVPPAAGFNPASLPFEVKIPLAPLADSSFGIPERPLPPLPLFQLGLVPIDLLSESQSDELTSLATRSLTSSADRIDVFIDTGQTLQSDPQQPDPQQPDPQLLDAPIQPSLPTSDQAQTWVAIGLLEEQTVKLIELESGQTLWQVAVGFEPSVVKIDPDQALVYASGPNAPGLVTIDLRTGDFLQGYGLPGGALDLAVDTLNRRVFASIPSSQSVAVIDLDQPEARNLPMPSPPLALEYDPDRNHLLVSLAGDDPLSLAVINPNNGELLSRWRAGNTPEDMVLDLERQRLLVLNSGSQDLSMIDLNSNGQTLKLIGLEWRPTRLDISPGGDFAYVTSRDSDRLQVVNLETSQLEDTFKIGSQPTGIFTLPVPNRLEVLVVEAGIPQLNQLSLGLAPLEVVTATTPETPLSGAISGQVLDIAGLAVAGGQVRIASTPTFAGMEAEINEEGRFLLEALPEGIHLLDVQVPNYPPTSAQVQVRAGFVATQDITLPPGVPDDESEGIGLIPDAPAFSDVLAQYLEPALTELLPERQISLLKGPLGPAEEFQALVPLTDDLTLLDRDERYTDDLRKLQLIGNTLGLRYILLTQIQISKEYNRQGSTLLNTAIRFLAPVVPVQIPNFTPNQLRSRGLVVVVDLYEDRPGDQATYFEAYGRDDVGGNPMFEDAAAGLFRLQARNMVPVFMDQWRNANPFVMAADPVDETPGTESTIESTEPTESTIESTEPTESTIDLLEPTEASEAGS